MQKNWVKSLFFLSSMLVSSVVISQEEGSYYRYKDKQGGTVISNNLPAEAANEGYEVISPRGNVLERVLPQKTENELTHENAEEEKKIEQEKQEQARQQQELIQLQKDEILLKSFSSSKDIVQSRDDKISAIEVLENITKDNIKRLEKQLNEANQMVVNYQQQKLAIPKNLQNTILDTQRQIKENQTFLSNKTSEKKQINKSYQELIDRFNQLKNPSMQYNH